MSDPFTFDPALADTFPEISMEDAFLLPEINGSTQDLDQPIPLPETQPEPVELITQSVNETLRALERFREEGNRVLDRVKNALNQPYSYDEARADAQTLLQSLSTLQSHAQTANLLPLPILSSQSPSSEMQLTYNLEAELRVRIQKMVAGMERMSGVIAAADEGARSDI